MTRRRARSTCARSFLNSDLCYAREMAGHETDVLCGIFVGGAATRMHGQPKGLLLSLDSGEPLAVRLVRIVTELGFEPALVGRADAYTHALPNVRVIPDRPAGIGPLGGLEGLLEAAQARPVIALACDMPHVTPALLRRLVDESPGAMVVAPRSSNGRWEPLCARYAARLVSPLCTAALARGVRSFQALFDALDVAELSLSHQERTQLEDWDRPEDIGRSP